MPKRVEASALPIVRIKFVEMTDVAPVAGLAAQKRFVPRKVPAWTRPVLPSAMKRNAEMMGVEDCVASVVMEPHVNPMVHAAHAQLLAMARSVERMDVEVPAESAPWGAVAVRKDNACARQTVPERNVGMMDVEDFAGPVVETNFAPHLALVLPAFPTALENNAETMDAEEHAGPVLMVCPVALQGNAVCANPIVQENTAEMMDVVACAAPAPRENPVEISFSV